MEGIPLVTQIRNMILEYAFRLVDRVLLRKNLENS